MGESVTVRDMKAFDELGDAALEFATAGVKFECGIEPTKGFTCDTSRAVIFRSPGIRPDAGDLTAAVESGAILTSEVEFFCEHTSARIFAITGSDGKTTTSTLTSLILKEGYKDGEVIQTAYTGRTVKSYRQKYDKATEKLISSTYEATSRYKTRDKIIARVEPKPTEPTETTPTPTPAPIPTEPPATTVPSGTGSGA